MQQWAHEDNGGRHRPGLSTARSGLSTAAGWIRAGALAGFFAGALVAGVVPARAGSIFGSTPQVPDWVKTAAQEKLPVFHGDPKAVVLLDETTYTVGTDNSATEHVRFVVKILRPQGRVFGYPAVWYDKDSKVVSMHVWRIDPEGHEYSLKDNEIMDLGRPSEGGEA